MRYDIPKDETPTFPIPSKVIREYRDRLLAFNNNKSYNRESLRDLLVDIFFGLGQELSFSQTLRRSSREHLSKEISSEHYLILRGDVKKYETPLIDHLDTLRATESLPSFFKELKRIFDKMEKASLVIEKEHLRTSKKFSHKGFKVHVFRMAKHDVNTMLKGIDNMVSLFEKRGVEEIIHESINHIFLRQQEEGEKNAGYWMSGMKVLIGVYSEELKISAGRFSDNFINEMFIHEVGHWVHMNYIPPSAKAYWDKPWLAYDKEVKRLEGEIKKKLKISPEERHHFWSLLQESKGNLAKVKKSLTPYKRAKLHFWLSGTHLNIPYVTPKNFRWVKGKGQDLKMFLETPHKFIEEHYGVSQQEEGYDIILQRREEKIKTDLMLEGLYDFRLISIPEEKVTDYISEDRDLNKQITRAILNRLEIPSEYGHTNVLEDFAESFAAFMLNPEKLSNIAKDRILTTLKMSESEGKRLMRLSKRVVKSYLKRG
jgi:hypothetical protein